MIYEYGAGACFLFLCLGWFGATAGEELDSLVGRVEKQTAKIKQYRAEAEVVEAFV